MTAFLPRIALLTTGGTIAGAGPSATGAAYTAAALDARALLAALPPLHGLARVQAEALFAIDSADLTDALLLQLARRVRELAARSDVDAIVITHGTDTLEESAHFLHLTVPTDKPLVLTGAMRAATALGADGPLNLYQAIQVAASGRAAGLGALIVMNGAIWSGRDTIKRHSSQAQALRSPYGPLGLVADEGPRFYRAPARVHTLRSEFAQAALPAALPAVAISASHAGMAEATARHWQALAELPVRGIVHAAFGAGTLPAALHAAAQRLHEAGIALLLASATQQGPLPAACRQGPWLCADDQPPRQARLLLALALARGIGPQGLQGLFDRY